MARILLFLATVSTLATSSAFAEGPKSSFDADFDVNARISQMEIIEHYLQENKPDKAVEQLSKMIDKDPKEIALHLVRGGILLRILKKPDEALKDFSKAIELGPTCSQAYKRRGEYFASFGKQDEAMADFNKCLSLTPDYGDVYVWRASVYAQQGKYKEAQADLDKAEKYQAMNVGMLTKIKAIVQAATQQGVSP